MKQEVWSIDPVIAYLDSVRLATIRARRLDASVDAERRADPERIPRAVGEPRSTAALDAETEHALFERYAAAARQRPDDIDAREGTADGRITILVSHRFSTVRMADRILVLRGGELVEEGTHAELLALGGLYSELFQLQAAGYR